jgi:hypothetical protein
LLDSAGCGGCTHSAPGGSYSTETADDKSLHFWSVPTDDGPVYIGIIDYPREGGGILEVGLEADYPPGFTAFRERIRDAMSHCKDGGLVTRYVSTKGGAIACDRGKATVNGAPFGLKHYPAIESPFARSRWDQGVMEFSINGKLLLLDARDLARPIRREQVAVNDWR